MDAALATGQDISATDLSSRILFTSFAAIVTTAAVSSFVKWTEGPSPNSHLQAATAALYQLCLNPRDVETIREEVEKVVSEEGWNKAALGRMYYLDSFLRETQRMHSAGTSKSLNPFSPKASVILIFLKSSLDGPNIA